MRNTNTKTQEWVQGKVICFLHLLYLMCPAHSAEYESGHPFPPADPPGPAALSSSTQEAPCIMQHHQALFWSREATKKLRETQSFPQSVPQSHVSAGKRGLVPTVQNYQEENMKYLALSSLPSPSLLNFPQGWKLDCTVCCFAMIIWMQLVKVKSQSQLYCQEFYICYTYRTFEIPFFAVK